MPPPILLLIYTFVILLFIGQSKHFQHKAIGKGFVSGVFLLKLVVGILYGWIHLHIFNMGDTFLFLKESNQLYTSFLREPLYMLGLGEASNTTGLYEYPPPNILLKDFGTYAFVHFNALLQPLTLGDYNLHIVFMALIGTYAGLEFFRALRNKLPVSDKLLLIFIFFMPSVLFWTSGFHKDGMVYLGLSLIVHGLVQYSDAKKGKVRLFLGLMVILIFRNYLLALLLPGIIAYLYADMYPFKKPFRLYFSIYFLAGLSVIFIDFFIEKISILEVLTARQNAFIQELGNSSFDKEPIFEPSWFHFLSRLPEAFINVAMRPFLWECNYFLQFLAALEITIVPF